MMQLFPDSLNSTSPIDDFSLVNKTSSFSGVELCHWRVGPNSVKYSNDSVHTVSLYLNGGHNTYRVDQRSNKGAPGKICLMPQGDESSWHVNDQLELVHLYFSDSVVKRYATSHLDLDARLVQIHDLTYREDRQLNALIVSLYQGVKNHQSSNKLFTEQFLHELFTILITRNIGSKTQNNQFKGGLSTSHRRKIKRFILDNLQEKLTIELLANQIGLSPFHFARIFKQSFGESPASYIVMSRIEKAKTLLKTGISVNQIAMQTGFSQQSHLTASFNQKLGITPAAYRKIVC